MNEVEIPFLFFSGTLGFGSLECFHFWFIWVLVLSLSKFSLLTWFGSVKVVAFSISCSSAFTLAFWLPSLSRYDHVYPR